MNSTRKYIQSSLQAAIVCAFLLPGAAIATAQIEVTDQGTPYYVQNTGPAQRGNQGQMPEHLKQRHQRMLERFDTDGDGKLNETERQQVKEAMMLRRFDADGDGQLNATERAEAEAAHQRILERFDADGDGKLNQQERRQAMRQHMLDKFDADGDGQLSEAERDQARAFAEQRRQKRQSQGAQRPAPAR